MKKENQENRKLLAELIKTSPVKTPIQEVRPLVNKETKNEVHLNIWIPADLMQSLKIYAAKNQTSIKQVGIEAFELLLKSNT